MYLYSGFQIRLCLQMHFMYVFVKVSLSVYMQSQFSVQFAKRNYFNMSHHLFQIYITAEKKNLDKLFFFFFKLASAFPSSLPRQDNVWKSVFSRVFKWFRSEQRLHCVRGVTHCSGGVHGPNISSNFTPHSSRRPVYITITQVFVCLWWHILPV